MIYADVRTYERIYTYINCIVGTLGTEGYNNYVHMYVHIFQHTQLAFCKFQLEISYSYWR